MDHEIAGSIVTMTSRAMFGVERGAHYATSKAGLAGLTRAMALELAPYGIRVNAIAPGMTDTAQARGAGTKEQLKERVERIPVRRMASVSEIAETAVFLASPRASFITGQVIHVNGGGHMG